MTLYTTLMQSRLDLPVGVFADLQGFFADFLQHLPCYLSFKRYLHARKTGIEEFADAEECVESYVDAYYNPPAAEWAKDLYLLTNCISAEHQAFIRSLKAQYEASLEEENWAFPNVEIVQAAYARMELLFKEYLVD